MKILLSSINVILGILFHGFVLQKLWMWIVVPTIPMVPPLSLSISIGIFLIVSFMTQYTPWHVLMEGVKYKEKNYNEFQKIAITLYRPFIYLAIGSIISYFI